VTQADPSNSGAEGSTDISQTTAAGPGVSQTTAAPPETQTQADKPTTEEAQTQGPSSTVGAPGDNGGQNVIQPNPFN